MQVFIYVPQVSLMLASKAQFLGHFGLLEQIKIQVFVISPEFLQNFPLVSHNSCFTCSLGVCLCVFQSCAPKAIFLGLELMLQQSLSGLLIVVWCYAWCFGTQFELNVYCVIILSLVRVKGDVISDITVVISYLLFFLNSASVWCQWTSSSAVHLV